MSRNTNPSAETVRLVRERDDWRCARCGFRDTSRSYSSLSTQHRRARGMGGSRWPGINRPANLLTLCGSGTTGCHGFVEANPTEAKDMGWSVSLHADPATVPVLTRFYGRVLLNDDGTTTPVEETENA